MSQEIAPTVTFNNGEQFPQIGLGTWRTQGDEMTHVIKTAIDQGYRMIDTAYSYGNEKIVGEAIKSKIKEGVIKRDDVFVVSKLWITDQKPSKIVESCKRSLFNLGLDYVDLYLIHWPTAFKNDDFGIMDAGKKSDFDESITLEEKWDKMEECVKLGLAKSIGVSNFNSEQIDRILKVANIKPVTNQVECHPYFNQKKLIQFCKERDIIITAYAPFGSPSKPKNAFTEIIPVITEEPTVIEIAKNHNKTPGQIILRYLVQLGVVPIPKSSNEKRMAENLKIFNFKLDSNEVASMDSLNKNLRSFPFKLAQNHRDYPFDLEF